MRRGYKAGRPLDALVVGGGPAGLAAGTHLARAGYSALLVERGETGGQARGIARIENYPGFPRGISGARLMGLWRQQAERWGLDIRPGDAVAADRAADGLFSVRLKNGARLLARSLLWCAGAGFRSLGVPGERALAGRGVWNTEDEAPSCAGLTVAVAGAGEAAVQQAAQLARRAARVYLVSRTGRLKAHPLLAERFSGSGALWLPGFRVSRLLGANRLLGAELVAVAGGRDRVTLRLDALFVLIGKQPRVAPAGWRRSPPGFFRAGDAAAGIFRQVAVAGGDGVRAAMRCIRFLEGLS